MTSTRSASRASGASNQLCATSSVRAPPDPARAAFYSCGARHRVIKDLDDGRRQKAPGTARSAMNLYEERDPWPDRRAPMQWVLVGRAGPARDEARLDQGALRGGGVICEEIEIAEKPIRWMPVVSGHLGGLHQHQPTAVRGARSLQQRRRRHRDLRGLALLGFQGCRHLRAA